LCSFNKVLLFPFKNKKIKRNEYEKMDANNSIKREKWTQTTEERFWHEGKMSRKMLSLICEW